MTDSPNSIAPPTPNDARPASFLARPRTKRLLWFILILLLALALRVWQLDVLPPGLHYDEAFNGTMARDVLRGVNRPIFFTPNFGEEPLHIYTEALLFALVGESPWAIRLVSAFFGVVFVAATYACARAFFPHSGLLALVAAFLAATLYWAINFSRIGIETNGLPMLIALSGAALAHAYRKMTWGWVIGAGFLMGATLYTYLASRLWLLAVFAWFLYLCIVHRQTVRANFNKWAVMGAVALLTLAPLILFFVANPVALSGRSGTVFTPETIITNLARTAGMFLLAGDTDPRDNLPGRPALDIVLFAFFAIGLALSLRRARQPYYALLVIWLVVMCLPSVLTEFAPNFRRAIGALPATLLLCALGVDWVWNKLSTLTVVSPGVRRAAQVAVVALLILSAFWNARAYFVEWASGSGLFYSFDAGLLEVAEGLAARPENEELYLTPDYDDHYTVIWALDGRPVSSFDGRSVLVLPNSSRAATYGIITREDTVTLARMDNGTIDAEALEYIRDSAGQPYAQISQLTMDSAVGADPDKWSRVDEFARLMAGVQGESRPTRDGTLHLGLNWQVIQPAARNYTTFVQLVGPKNPVTGSTVWAQADTQPGNGTYPTQAWREGQTVLENFMLKIPSNALLGEYQVMVGMYLLETGERVPLYAADGSRLPDDALRVQQFTLK